MSNLTTEQVISNLKKGELKCQKKRGGSSDVWRNFNEIINMQEESIDFVICKICKHVFKYNYTTGTSALKRYKCPSDEKQPKITSYWTSKNFLTTAKDIVIKKIINLVCKDLCSFEIIVGQSFREFS